MFGGLYWATLGHGYRYPQQTISPTIAKRISRAAPIVLHNLRWRLGDGCDIRVREGCLDRGWGFNQFF